MSQLEKVSVAGRQPFVCNMLIAFLLAVFGLQVTALEAASHADNQQIGVPGPRDCFWLRGPFGADPYVNLAYPDANVYYWAAVFTVPDGARLELLGEYPHSRYMSFVSYESPAGIPARFSDPA